MAACSSSGGPNSISSIIIHYQRDDIQLEEYPDLTIRIRKALENCGIMFETMLEYIQNPENKLKSRVEYDIEERFTTTDELQDLVRNHLNVKRFGDIQKIDELIKINNERLAELQQKQEKLKNDGKELTVKQKELLKTRLERTSKLEKKRQQILENVKSRSSIIEDLEQANTWNDLMSVAITQGIYYLFKYLYFSEEVGLPKEFFTAQPRALHSNTEVVDEVESRIVGIHEKVTLHTEGGQSASCQRIERLFESVKTISKYGKIGEGWYYYYSDEGMQRDLRRHSIAKLDTSSRIFLHDFRR